jgi:ABC-type multidrug transport system fused ATPase/permease subunit
MHLAALVKRYKKRISLALSLVIIENAAWIVEPFLFGLVIDGIIDKAYVDPESNFIFPLLLWIAAFLINSGVGSLRRSLDTRIYLNIFSNLAADVSKKSIESNLSVSKTAARAELSYQYVTFLQYRIPEVIEHAIAIFGAVIAMYLIDWRISLTSGLIIIPLYFITRFYNSKILKLQTEYHDKYENIFDIFSTKDPEKVREYYQNMAKPQKKISDWGAFNFGIMRIVLLIIFLSVLYIAIDLDDFSAGELYTIVAYLWTFISSTEYLPELFESWTSLTDISKRLKKEVI